MSDSAVDLVSGFEVEISPTSIIGTSLDSHLPPLGHNHLGLETILLSDDLDSERVYGSSLEEEISLFGSLEAFLSNVGGEVNHNDVLIPPHILYKEEIQSNWKKREHTKDYIQLCMRTDNYEPNGVEVNAHLDL